MNSLFKVSKIKFINRPKGNIFTLIQNINNKIKFDELYISELNSFKIKAWKFHEKKIQRIYIPIGKVKVAIYQPKIKKIKTVVLGEASKKMITIYNGVFYGFKSISKKKSLILNLTYFSNKNKNKPLNQPNIKDIIL